MDDQPTAPQEDQPETEAHAFDHLPHLPHRVGHHAHTPHSPNQTPQPEHSEFREPHSFEEQDIDLDPAGFQQKSHKVRAIATITIGVALLAGLSATWYHSNPGVYSLGAQGSQVSQANPSPSQPATLGAELSQKTLAFDFTNLKPLSVGHYQAWSQHGDQTTSLGAFKIADDGSAQSADGSPFNPQVSIADGDQIFVTIESGFDATTSPSQTVILSGSASSSQVKLAFNAVDLSKASGTYVLDTPTDPTANPKSGIWFASTDGKTLTGPGLKLPKAPDGWKYEGQITYKNIDVEIGRFADPGHADEFNKFTPNPGQTPDFPGEDFLQKAPSQLGFAFPIDLTTGDWQVSISLEPDQDGNDPTGTDKFFLIPLKANIAQGSDALKAYPLSLDLSGFPAGTASLD